MFQGWTERTETNAAGMWKAKEPFKKRFEFAFSVFLGELVDYSISNLGAVAIDRRIAISGQAGIIHLAIVC
jgi:hypothetical protein